MKLTKELFEESLDCTPDLKDLEILFKAADGKVLAQALHYATAMIGSSPNPMEMLAKTVLAFYYAGMYAQRKLSEVNQLEAVLK